VESLPHGLRSAVRAMCLPCLDSYESAEAPLGFSWTAPFKLRSVTKEVITLDPLRFQPLLPYPKSKDCLSSRTRRGIIHDA